MSRSLEGRNIAMLVDTSASMQRNDVWEKAKEQATKFIASLSPPIEWRSIPSTID